MYFNPRPPQEGRPDSLEEAMEVADISIHVPRKRDDDEIESEIYGG